jgi:Rho-binding antiterminator
MRPLFEFANRNALPRPYPEPIAGPAVPSGMESNYKPVENRFRQAIESLVAARKKATFNYITDLRELLTTTGLAREVVSRNGADYLTLSTGEEIRLDRIVRVDNTLAPGYESYDFGNSCAL